MTSRLPPLYALRAFEVAARYGSFTVAAQNLCITQSAVSRHVKTLEDHLGAPLFERKGPKLALTDTGRLLAHELERSFNAIENACATARRPKGTLRVKAPSTITMRWLMQALESFQAANVTDRVQLTSAWMDLDTVDFRNEPFDCAVLLSNGDFPKDWNFIKLFDEWLVPVCAPSVYGKGPWGIEHLALAELIHPSRDCRDWRRWLERQGEGDAVDWNEGKRFDTLELGMTAAAGGHGVSIGDLALVGPQLKDGSLVLPIRTAVRTGDSYYLIWSQRNPEHYLLERVRTFLLANVPVIPAADILMLD
ncbi:MULTISPECIES: LysR substrate-binding domain-containing protein [Pseudomonas]|nr:MULTISPECIES: LysR substrate-binding domain-containing protein [Pseudomonas]